MLKTNKSKQLFIIYSNRSNSSDFLLVIVKFAFHRLEQSTV